MSVLSLDSNSFGRVVSRRGIVLIEWWAAWCEPYRVFGPVLEQMVGRHDDVTLARVDVDAQSELVEVLGVQVMPTLMVFREGHLLLNHPGALPELVVERAVRRARLLDMERCRRLEL